MSVLNYISNLAMPLIILIIVFYSLIERKKAFDIFLDGAKDGLNIVLNIFPTLIGLFVAIGALRSSGILDLIINFITPILDILNFPSEIMPLAILRPISGSSSIAIATDIMKNFGVDSNIGIIAATIMGSTETTLYTIAVYTSSVKIKKTRFVLWAALTADIVGMLASVAICRMMS
ncbi:MAG: spore maturation protein [Clostridium sp.]|nr:spore maturation protein [Clostridium sp.]